MKRIIKKHYKDQKSNAKHYFVVQELITVGLFRKSQVWRNVEEIWFESDMGKYRRVKKFDTLAEAKRYLKPLPKDKIEYETQS